MVGLQLGRSQKITCLELQVGVDLQLGSKQNNTPEFRVESGLATGRKEAGTQLRVEAGLAAEAKRCLGLVTSQG